MNKTYLLSFSLLTSALFNQIPSLAQSVPELMYYKFDSSGVSQYNYASSPVGVNPSPLVGITTGVGGQFGTGLVGNGAASDQNSLANGWPTSLGSGPWTISMWLANVPATPAGSFYFFGDAGASFRCFTGGIAGNDNVLLRGTGLTDVSLSSIGSAPFVVHFVHEVSPANVIKAYKNGVLVSTVAQAAPLNISGNGFRIGGYSTVSSLPAGCIMDEFRMYNRALSAAEVASTWNVSLGTPLSVKSMDLTGKVENNSVSLSWFVPDETDVESYVVERSIDGREFSILQLIPKRAGANTYTIVDHGASGAAVQDAIYYRVVAKTFKGESQYSKVLKLLLNRPDARFTISPNPFVDNILIAVNAPKTGIASVRLIDALGRVVKEKEQVLQEGRGEIRLTGMETVPAGKYQIILDVDGSTHTSAVMKSN
jgi:hypothetical protein